ncbi:MAG: response regulator transcription factor [Phycisphaerales bacterium]
MLSDAGMNDNAGPEAGEPIGRPSGGSSGGSSGSSSGGSLGGSPADPGNPLGGDAGPAGDETVAGAGFSEARPVRVLIVDDHRVVADALSALIEVTDGVEVCRVIYDAFELAEAMRIEKPDVVLSDLEMPGGDPLTNLADGLAAVPQTRVVVLTAYPTDANIRRAIDLDVAGFLTKHEPAEAILEGLRAVAAGHEVFSDAVRSRFMLAKTPAAKASRVIELSPRELHVVRLVAGGMTTAEIAESVYRSPKTVEKQISSAMEKTSSGNRVELTRWAIREGLVQP